MDSGETTASRGALSPTPEAAVLAALTDELREAIAPGLLLLEKLGEGGMGLVFLARDPALKRLVVIKVLAPWLAEDEKARMRFAREAESAAAVAHPNVVGIFQVGQLPRSGTSYFVMQFVDGPTLEQAFPPGTVAALPRARRIVGEIAAALAAAHARGVVHRDIKPANIMIDRDSERVVVLDFGISAASATKAGPDSTRLTAQGTSIGTPLYMSPEQAVGEDVTDRSDVYSLGMVAFELVAGRPVFEETLPMALIAAHINRAPPRLAEARSDVDPTLAELVDRCLSKRPSDRPSAADVSRALLPGAHAVVEWPPPGLERLHGVGAALSRVTAWLGAGVLGLLALLYLQPSMATGAWFRGESSWFWRVVWAPAFALDGLFLRPIECSMRASEGGQCPPALVDAVPLWLFALALLGLALVFGAARATRLAVGLVRAVRTGRRSGYTTGALLETAWDAGPDTADLLNGAGAYALASVETRASLRSRRYRASRWMLVGALCSGFAPLLWLLGGLHLGADGAWWVSPLEFGVAAVPLLGALLVRERLLRAEGALRRKWHQERRAGGVPSVAHRSLVDGWLTSAASLGLAAEPVRPRVRVAAAIAMACGAVACAAAVFAGSQFFAFWHMPTIRAWQSDWYWYAGNSNTSNGWLQLDSMLSHEIARLAREGSALSRVVPVLGAPRPRQVRAAMQVRSPYEFSNQDIEHLAADSVWAWMPSYRSRSDSAMTWTPSAEPSSRLIPNTSAGMAAILAFEAGDAPAARAWVRRQLALARVKLAQAGRPGSNIWWRITDAVELHRAVSRASGDPLGAEAASSIMRQLTSYFEAHRAFFFGLGSTGLMSDPVDPVAEDFVSRRTLAPGVRDALAESSVMGQCFNGREMLFGPSPLRTGLIDRIRTAVADLPWVVARVDSLRADANTALRRPGGMLAFPARWQWCLQHVRF